MALWLTQPAKVTVTAHDKMLIKVERALNFWVEKHDFYCSVIP